MKTNQFLTVTLFLLGTIWLCACKPVLLATATLTPEMGATIQPNTPTQGILVTNTSIPNITGEIQTAVADSVAQTLNAQTIEPTLVPTSTSLFAPSSTPGIALSDDSDSTGTNQTITPVSASAGIGHLTVRVLEECDNKSFSMQANDLVIGGGQANTDILVGAGTYDIVFTSDFDLGKPITQTVEIREGEETIVDFTDELGAVLLTGYPELSLSLPFYANTILGNMYWFVGEQYCASIGAHTIRLLDDYWAVTGYNSGYRVTIGLFDNSEMTFDIEVKAGEQTIIGPDVWPRQLGIVSFDPPVQGWMGFKILDLQTGEQRDYSPYKNLDHFWIPAGTYKFVMSNPYPGLPFDNIEIIAGEEAVLQLPTPTSSTP